MTVGSVEVKDKLSIKISELEIVKNQQWLLENTVHPLKKAIDKYDNVALSPDDKIKLDGRKEQHRRLNDLINQSSNLLLEYSFMVALCKTTMQKLDLLYDDQGEPVSRLWPEQKAALKELREDVELLLKAINHAPQI